MLRFLDRLLCRHPEGARFVRAWYFRAWIGLMEECLACGTEIDWARKDRPSPAPQG
jgi:hypothetical protein